MAYWNFAPPHPELSPECKTPAIRRGELASEHRRLMNWLCLLVLLVETHMGDLEVGAPSKKKKKIK
jgi:hypothetical protein